MGAKEGSYRPLTDWEQRLIQRLLTSPFPGSDALLLQLEHGLASSIDEDGTPLDENGSLYLKTSSPVQACVKARVPAEAQAPDIDGVMIHYLLFVGDDGKIQQLEIFREDSSKVQRHVETEELEVMVAG